MPLKQFYFIFALSLFLTAANTVAAPKVGNTFGSWGVECRGLAAKKVQCALSQTLILNKTKHRLLSIALSKLDNSNKWRLVVVVPLGVYIPEAVIATVDKKTKVPLVLKTCNQQGCFATANVDSKLIKTLKRGNFITFKFSVNAGTKPITIKVSLKGITAGINALNEK